MAKKGHVSDVQWIVFDVTMGWLGIAASPRGLVEVGLPRKSERHVVEEFSAAYGGSPIAETQVPAPLLDLKQRLVAYFQGQSVAFDDVQLDPTIGTPFQQRVWAELRKVPAGEVVSYGELARRAGFPGAARGAGQAMAHNPCTVIVPCHRVIGSDGGLHGFGGGLEMKAQMLALEGYKRTGRRSS